MKDHPIRVLYVDTNPSDLEQVKARLEREGGYQITTAANRATLETYLAEGEFDLVLTDIEIGGFSGLDVLDAVRSRWPSIPVVSLTGENQEEAALDAIAHGVNIFAHKIPEDIQQLPAIFTIALERARRQELRRQTEAELRRKNAELELLHSLHQAVNRGEGLKQILAMLSAEYKRLFDCFGVAIYLLSEDRQHLVMQFPGMSPDQIARIEKIIRRPIPEVCIPKRMGSWYWDVLESGRPAIAHDPAAIQSMMAELTENQTLKKLIPKIGRSLGLLSVITAPLTANGETIGVIDTSRRTPFSQADLLLLEHIACEVTIILKRQMVENKLRESEARYRDLVEHSRDLICTHDLEGKVLSVNPWFAQVLGYDIETLLQSNIRDILMPDVKDEFDAYLNEIAQNGFARGLMSVQTTSGEQRIWEYHNILRAEGIAAPVVYGIGHDLTERIQFEKALARRAAQQNVLNTIIVAATRGTDFQQLLETALDHILQAFNLEIGAIWVNEWRAYRNLPPKFPALVVKAAQDANLRLSAVTPIEDWEQAKTLYPHLAPMMLRFDLRASLTAPILTREGRIGGLGVISSQPRRWDREEIALAGAIGHQLGAVARRLQLVQEVTATRDYYSRILNGLHDEILIINRDYRVTDVNEPFLRKTGFQRAEVIGEHCYEVSHHVSTPCWQQADKDHPCPVFGVWQTGRSTRARHLHYDAQGQPAWMDLAASPLRNGDGEIRWAVEACREVTAEINLRSRLESIYRLGQVLTLLQDEEAIIEKVLTSAADLLDFDAIACGLVDECAGELDYRHGIGTAADGLRLPLDGERGIGVAVVRMGETIYLPDVSANSRYVGVDGWSARSEICVPLKVGDKIIGVLNGESEQLAAFSPEDQQILQTLADQASVAIENARLYQQTRRQLDELSALFQVATALRDAASVKEMYPIVLTQAMAALGIDSGVLFRWDERAGVFTATAASGLLSRLSQAQIKSKGSICGHVKRTRQVYIFGEMKADKHIEDALRPLVSGVMSGISAPVIADNWFWGTLILGSAQARQFTEEDSRLLTSIATMTATAIQRASLHEETNRRVAQLGALNTIGTAITSSKNLMLTLNLFLEQARTQLKADAVAVLLFNPLTMTLNYTASEGMQKSYMRQASFKFGVPLAGRVALERKICIVPALQKETNLPDEFQALIAAEHFATYVGMPLFAKSKLLGVLEVFYRKPFDPDPSWRDFLTALASQAAIAIENATLFENLQQSHLELTVAYDTTLEGWAKALELRDQETEGHSRRVTEMTLKLARQAGIRDDQLVHVRRGALLHDIGKMGIPDKVLLKQGALNEDEWALMRQHPVYAYQMLGKIPFLKKALDIPYCHHEKWDGSGYPRGLKGEEIPLAARIFAIVDVWDALTSDRPYRKAWKKDWVLDYIQEQSGTHFDPHEVEVFLALVNSE